MANRNVKSEKDSAVQDKLQVILGRLLQDDDNKYCVDCDSKGNSKRMGLEINQQVCDSCSRWKETFYKNIRCLSDTRKVFKPSFFFLSNSASCDEPILS